MVYMSDGSGSGALFDGEYQQKELSAICTSCALKWFFVLQATLPVVSFLLVWQPLTIEEGTYCEIITQISVLSRD